MVFKNCGLTFTNGNIKSNSRVVTPVFLSQDNPILGFANPLAGPDQQTATWFHAHLTPIVVTILRGLSEPASSEWIGVALFVGVLFFAWKRSWLALATMIIAVPGGMLLNEWIKVLVHRPRPFVEGPFVNWAGYSFASGHTIAATLLYGQILLFVLPLIKSRSYRAGAIALASAIVLLVGFSRIALGAHYLTDVLAAMFFGVAWLTLCFFLLKPLQRVSLPGKLIPDVGVTSDELMPSENALALVRLPVSAPVVESKETPQILSVV
jgi:undecaprenyl-diphosphatase